MSSEAVIVTTAFHEAGHAVAAVMRGGSSLLSAELGAVHGEGLTRFNSSAWDIPFIAYAGPWAEARFMWGSKLMDDLDADGLNFDDYVVGVMLSQPEDAHLVDSQWIVVLDGAAHPELMWMQELEGEWRAMVSLAQMILDGKPITDAVVRAMVQR